MIPVRIQLRNFMSYGDSAEPLDFRGMHVACLSGENGNGKSALLDAITWALWGEARASADELIRLGCDEMRVVFEFELNGDLYRVIRGRSKKSSGNVWEVYIADESGGFRAITGQGIRDTERVIKRILRMDYKTFINSAYIQQGHADEFTKQTVADRKRILADILDLSRYDALEQKAKERRNEREQRIQELTREIERIEAEVSGEAMYEEQLAASKSERDALETRIQETDTRLAELRERLSALEAQRRRIEEVERQIRSLRSERAGLLNRRAEHEARAARFRETILDRERILAGHANLQSARELVVELDRRMDSSRALEIEKSKLERAIVEARHRLQMEEQGASRELAELRVRVDGGEAAQRDLRGLEAQVAELDGLDAQLHDLQTSVATHADRMGELKAQHDAARHLKTELEEKLAMIREPGALCPLCGAELGDAKHEGIVQEYRSRIDEAEARIGELRRLGVEVRALRESAQKKATEILGRQKDGMATRDKLAQARQALSQIEESAKRVPDAERRLEAVKGAIERREYAQAETARAREIDAQLAALQYDPAAHKRARAELASLQPFEALRAGLSVAEESLPSEESGLQVIAELVAAREKSIAECEKLAAELSESVREFDSVAAETRKVADELQIMRDTDRSLTARIATLEQALSRCAALKAHLADARVDLQRARKEKSVYSDLVAAFGKKGVQALIIENAIPEIQEEANRLLSRMTDNAMQVSIETVKDKKTGGVAETLDIRISDDLGTRSYELFSGGEAFRVNFALRIALSKLLARRAGARLQTLIVDEGFGTQDGKGREKLVDAINSVQDDFDLILVITHIDELKDAFPTRIDVVKDSSGSQFTVN